MFATDRQGAQPYVSLLLALQGAPPVQQLDCLGGRWHQPWVLPRLKCSEAMLALLWSAACRRAAAIRKPCPAQFPS